MDELTLNVFLTGANGFVGLNIVSSLLERGHRVHAYVRESSSTKYLNKLDVTVHKGSLNDLNSMNKAMKQCDAVIHCAGNTSTYKHDLDNLRLTNVEGTKTVIKSMLENDVQRIVYTSTTSTIGAENSSNYESNEDKVISGFRKRSPYAITKIQAEDLLVNSIEAGLEPIILNPAEIIGPYDHNLQWGRLILAVCHDQLPFIPPGSATFCSSKEVGHAHEAALNKGTPGEKYILGGTHATFKDFISVIGKITGKTITTPKTPYSYLRVQSELKKLAYRFTKQLPLVDPYRMKIFSGNYLFDSTKAVKTFSYRPCNLDTMVGDCFSWYEDNQFI